MIEPGPDESTAKVMERWLDALIEENNRHRHTIKRLLAQPRLPEHPTSLHLRPICCVLEKHGIAPREAYSIYRALYANLTRPATKTVQRWHLEYGSGEAVVSRNPEQSRCPVCDSRLSGHGDFTEHMRRHWREEQRPFDPDVSDERRR